MVQEESAGLGVGGQEPTGEKYERRTSVRQGWVHGVGPQRERERSNPSRNSDVIGKTVDCSH